jgi:hypothetical protein
MKWERKKRGHMIRNEMRVLMEKQRYKRVLWEEKNKIKSVFYTN